LTGFSWADNIAKKEADRDVLSSSARFGGAISIVIIFLIFLFFVSNQIQDTGFFTSEFGTIEMAFFYGSLLFGMFAPLLRMFLGKRNQVRPVELISNLFFVIAASYLLSVFPFDFTHLADLLPESIKFIFDWITNDIVMVALSLIIVLVIAVSIWTAFLYVIVRDWMRAHPSPSATQ
jgi:hypothetical protein